MPPLAFVLFELGTYATAAYTFYRVGRRDRYELLLLLAALGFGLCLEASALRSALPYYYNPFLVMVGTRPTWVPLCIGVAYSLVVSSAMRATRGLLVPYWWLPAIDALLAVALALVFDPVLAADRWVQHFGEWCALRGYPLGPAPGIGFWIWCVPRQGAELLYGIPLDSFVSWFVAVFAFSMLARIVERTLRPRSRRLWTQVAIAVGLGLASYLAARFVPRDYAELLTRGASQPLVLGGLLAVPAAMLVVAGGSRARYGFDWVALLFPLGLLGYCWVAYFATGVFRREGVAFFVFLLGVTVALLLTYAWLMRGRRAQVGVDAVLKRAAADHPAVASSVEQARIEAIGAVDDCALRSLWITQTYHDLSLELSKLTRPRNANWASFASWASCTAGEALRDEALPAGLLAALRDEGELEDTWRALSDALCELHPEAAPEDAVDAVRDAVATLGAQLAEGNWQVFAEVAPLFVAFIASFREATHYAPARYEEFATRFRSGSVEHGGQDLLRSGFGAYYRAMFEPDRARKAQWMLLGNLQLSLHEQSRLQPSIRAAMDTPLSVAFRRQLAARARAHVPVQRYEQLHLVLAKAAPIEQRLDAAWARAATHTMMHLTLVGGVSVALDEDVLQALQRIYPRELRQLAEPELSALVARFGASGAEARDRVEPRDWAELDQRMVLIVELFRTTQQQSGLLAQPLTRRQRARLARTLAAQPRGNGA